jgi:nucleoside-diphosphate-sugar epimerase
MPLSLYSKCKVNSEKFILDHNNDIFETCVLRFATAHGLSPRMRFDLLVQEFMRDAIVDKKISIFGADFWRPLVHVEDMADACISAIDAPSQVISGHIYNVGSDKIKSKKDPRNYKVSFEKIKNSLNFEPKYTVRDSVIEILNDIRSGKIDPRDSEFSNMSKLTEKINALYNYNFT